MYAGGFRRIGMEIVEKVAAGAEYLVSLFVSDEGGLRLSVF